MAAILASMRKDKILTFLRDNSSATVAELSDLCDVSEVTIRQDLNALAVEGMLVRTTRWCDPIDAGSDRFYLQFAAGDQRRNQTTDWRYGCQFDPVG